MTRAVVTLSAFQPADILAIDVQPDQRGQFDPHDLAIQLMLQRSVTLRDADSRIILIAGAITLYPHHAVIHAILATGIGSRMVAVTRAARAWFDTLPFTRLTAWVDPSHEAAMQWIAMLGFSQEGVMPGFGPGGRVMTSWGRLQSPSEEHW